MENNLIQNKIKTLKNGIVSIQEVVQNNLIKTKTSISKNIAHFFEKKKSSKTRKKEKQNANKSINQ